MGMHPQLGKGGDKRKNRWMFTIQPYIGIEASMLPPSKGARPNMSFKEYSAEHLHETIYFPGKVEWQTVELSLYDVKCDQNPIYDWMLKAYNPDPDNDFYGPALDDNPQNQFKVDADVVLYDGCGNVLETWTYMNAYPAKIDWGDLDMGSNEITMVDLTLRFDRAYRVQNQAARGRVGGASSPPTRLSPPDHMVPPGG